MTVVGASSVALSLAAGAAAAAAAWWSDGDRRERLVTRLPGIDCGACGSPACAIFAERILAAGERPLPPCFPLLKENRLEPIERAFGVTFRRPVPRVARVLCGAGPGECAPTAERAGFTDCHAARRAGTPLRRCAVGCLSLGSCAAVCPTGALAMRDGLPRVDESLCVGCGLCARECPQLIIALKSPDVGYVVACVNEEKAAQVHQICTVGCLACHVCYKVCPADAIVKLENRVAIDVDKCVNCGLCVLKCPTDAIAAFRRDPQFVRIDAERCNGCGACVAKCPVGAIAGETAKPHRVAEATCIGCGICLPACPAEAIRPRVVEE